MSNNSILQTVKIVYEQQSGRKLVDLDVPALVGYYTKYYGADPVSALEYDMLNLKVSKTRGLACRSILKSLEV